VVYLLAGLCVGLPLFWLLGFCVGRVERAAARARSSPGYVQRSLSAYGYASPTTAATRTRAGIFTASKAQAEVTAGRAVSHGHVRITSPTSSGEDSEFRLGGRMTGADAA
jgi:hypothetical protein